MNKKNAFMTLAKSTSVQKLSSTYADYCAAINQVADPFQRSVITAAAMKALEESLGDEVMESYIMPLADSPLGFRTDRDPKTQKDKPPYSIAQVRACYIEATLKGLQSVGNQWNIIAGRCYVTKEGMSHSLQTIHARG